MRLAIHHLVVLLLSACASNETNPDIAPKDDERRASCADLIPATDFDFFNKAVRDEVQNDAGLARLRALAPEINAIFAAAPTDESMFDATAATQESLRASVQPYPPENHIGLYQLSITGTANFQYQAVIDEEPMFVRIDFRLGAWSFSESRWSLPTQRSTAPFGYIRSDATDYDYEKRMVLRFGERRLTVLAKTGKKDIGEDTADRAETRINLDGNVVYSSAGTGTCDAITLLSLFPKVDELLMAEEVENLLHSHFPVP